MGEAAIARKGWVASQQWNLDPPLDGLAVKQAMLLQFDLVSHVAWL